ncbi:MAG TPA: hypothetical protein VKK19_05660 [Candidatus Dormibacteraeota bacterium]|nr:hypothetical protein [Candidatus Dormibacteraeota bacterium]
MPNEALLGAFRHNAWATRQLVEFCGDLLGERLTAPASGTFGGILATRTIVGTGRPRLRASPKAEIG